jgi:hypothetical protein
MTLFYWYLNYNNKYEYDDYHIKTLFVKYTYLYPITTISINDSYYKMLLLNLEHCMVTAI